MHDENGERILGYGNSHAGRTKTNVLRSLKTLKQFDIVDFEEGEGGRKAPRLNYDDFRVDGRLGANSKGKAA